MKSNKSFLLLSLMAALALGSCSGLPKTAGGGGGGGGNNNGNAFVNITITSTPSSTFSFPSLTWPIGNMFIIDSAGQSITLGGTVGVAFPDFARLQTDSLYIGHVTLKATSYTSLKVEFNSPLFSYFYNSSSSTLFGCATGTVCLIPSTVPGFGATSVTVPITYSTAPNSNTGIRINFDLSKAVTNAGGMTFDWTQKGAITLTPLPTPSSQTSGLDTMDNFTGTVTAITGTTITVSSFASEARTFTVAANAEFDDPSSICGGQASFSCLAVNQNVSLDGVVNSDATFTADEVEFLDPAPVTSELEGVIITPVANNQFKMVLTNGMGPAGLIVTSTVIVNLNNAESYFVDPKNLGAGVSTTPVGFLSQSDLVMGQTVMLRGGTINFNNTSLNNSTRVLLRYSSIGGTIQTPSGTTFTLSGVSPFLTSLVTNSVAVQTFPNTDYDNISGFSGLVTGTNASVRGLYLNPTSGAVRPLLAAKVRTH